MGLGFWWLYLIIFLSKELNRLQGLSAEFNQSINFISLAKWEGLTFLVLLFLVSFFLLFIYFQDLKKASLMQDFFAAVTHELKTPLASIRLQAQVMQEMLEVKNYASLEDLNSRLIEDTQRLESELEKILQLARLERGGGLNLVTLNLPQFLQNFIKKEKNQRQQHPYQLEFHFERLPVEINHPPKKLMAKVDEFALTLILRNLVENTLKHHPQLKGDKNFSSAQPNPNGLKINLSLEKDDKNHLVHLIYNDHGGPFDGDDLLLGTLFYKHRSSGSGIGLYLIKKLMQKMQGELSIATKPLLTFKLTFPLMNEDEEKEEGGCCP